jgi:ubiquinone/menaquinone biosynthesis C-methylase UbiE
MPEYGSRLYWEKRYARLDQPFDWMCDYDQLEPTILPLLKQSKSNKDDVKILIVGCGNAPFSFDFTSRSGFKTKNIIHIDYCHVVIEQQKERHPDLDFRLVDALNMVDFDDHTFDFIIDKSLLDTMICYHDGHDTTEKLFNELHRVLKPGGRVVTISLHTEEEVKQFKSSENYTYQFLVSSCKLMNIRR